MWLFFCLRPTAAADSMSIHWTLSHSRPQLVSGLRRVGSCCAYDKMDGCSLFPACPPACVPAYVMRIPCSPIFAAFGLGFGRCTIAIAAADKSYMNLIAPHQRVQPVSGLVCLYFLLLIHSRRFEFRFHVCLPHLRPVNSIRIHLYCIECGFLMFARCDSMSIHWA